ncbi:MAG: hypothetical protein GX763_03040 [Clostridiaceae bacterium]|nr:hypothetical protein [Clostridiaceae bacterium]
MRRVIDKTLPNSGGNVFGIKDAAVREAIKAANDNIAVMKKQLSELSSIVRELQRKQV